MLDISDNASRNRSEICGFGHLSYLYPLVFLCLRPPLRCKTLQAHAQNLLWLTEVQNQRGTVVSVLHTTADCC